MDLRLCEFVQHTREEGGSGLMHLLRAWSKNELPMRYDSLPMNLLLAMVGAALEARN